MAATTVRAQGGDTCFRVKAAVTASTVSTMLITERTDESFAHRARLVLSNHRWKLTKLISVKGDDEKNALIFATAATVVGAMATTENINNAPLALHFFSKWKVSGARGSEGQRAFAVTKPSSGRTEVGRMATLTSGDSLKEKPLFLRVVFTESTPTTSGHNFRFIFSLRFRLFMDSLFPRFVSRTDGYERAPLVASIVTVVVVFLDSVVVSVAVSTV